MSQQPWSIECKYCGKPITFNSMNTSKRTGKKIPLDPNGQIHVCPARQKGMEMTEQAKCFKCGKEIDFNEQVLSPKNRMIPLEKGTLNPHDCQNYRQQV